MNLGELWEVVRDREAWSLDNKQAVVRGLSKSWTAPGDWTTECCKHVGECVTADGDGDDNGGGSDGGDNCD